MDAGEGATEYLAECFWPGVTDADVAALDARVRARVSSAEGVRYLGARLVRADDVVFCLFEGPSAEAIRAAAERAEIPFERILEWSGVPTGGGLSQ